MSLPVPLGELWSRTSCWFQTEYPHAPSGVPLDVSAQTTQTLSSIAQGCSAQPFLWLPVCTGVAWAAALTPSLSFTTWSWPLQNASITLASASLDISSCPLTPFPAPTLTPQPLFWPVCWTHWGLGVGQWSLHVKNEHYWVSDMYDSTHKCAYTHMCVYTHARAACSVVSDAGTIFCDTSL